MLARRLVLLFPLGLAACGEEESPETFPLPSYSYLTPLRLNVASVEAQDMTPPPGDNGLEGLDPVRPADALKQMAADRLFADGSAGRAVFVIDQAKLNRSRGGIEGTMAVHLDVYAGAGGQRAGFAEARVTRRRTSSNASENLRAVLHEFTMQMANDMNVEFEYQVRRSLRDWLQTTAGAAPPPAPVQAQPLPGAGATTPAVLPGQAPPVSVQRPGSIGAPLGY